MSENQNNNTNNSNGTNASFTIVHVSTQITWHGGEEQARQLVRGLCLRGHRCSVLARAGGEFALRMSQEGYDVHEFPGRGRNPRALWKLRRLIRRLQPDVIHFHDSHALSGPGFAVWGAGIRARVASRRVDLPARSPWVYRNLCDRVIAVSHAVANVCRNRGIPDRMIRVVYDGVDPQRAREGNRERGRAAAGVRDDQLMILTVASLRPNKGHRYLLQALPHVLQRLPHVHAVFAGDGPLRSSLEHLASELNIAHKVTFLGYRRDVGDLLKAADVFVLPSIQEGLGSSLLDVMFARVPLVTTSAGGIPEVVGMNVPGAEPVAMVVPPHNPEALARALILTLESPELRNAMVDRAEQRALQLHTTDHMVEHTLQVYREILAARENGNQAAFIQGNEYG